MYTSVSRSSEPSSRSSARPDGAGRKRVSTSGATSVTNGSRHRPQTWGTLAPSLPRTKTASPSLSTSRSTSDRVQARSAKGWPRESGPSIRRPSSGISETRTIMSTTSVKDSRNKALFNNRASIDTPRRAVNPKPPKGPLNLTAPGGTASIPAGGPTPMGNVLKTGFLLAVLTCLVVLVGKAIGGQQGMLIALVLAVVMNFFSYWFSDKMVLAMYRAQPVDEAAAPELYAMVRGLATRAQVPMPKVYIIPTDTPNAFATGRNPEHAAVAVTEGIMRILSREELEGVIAHELSHVKNRDTLIMTVAATMAGAITYLAQMAQFAAIFGGSRRDSDERGGGVFGTLALAILAPIAAMLVQLAISRAREF